jgi:PPIC-type PPIASE domain
MYYCAVIAALFTSLALAQTSPPQKSDAPSDQIEHQRHEDDDDPPPATAANIPPGNPIITIAGLCDRPGSISSGSISSGSISSGSISSGSTSAGSISAACKTIVTKAQFETLVAAVNPQMSPIVKRQLADSYPRMLLFADKAQELGLDHDPSFAEALRFASIQLLTQRLNRYFDEQASKISDSDIEAYYKGNAIKFERGELLRIFVPKQTGQAKKAVSGDPSGTAIDSSMRAVAEKIRARAAAGEDFQQLQKEAFAAAGIASGSPNVSTGKIAGTALPLSHQKVFELEPGQVSDVIAESSGYYIYKMVSKQMVPLASASSEIRKSITSQRVQDATASLLKTIKPELDPMYFGESPGSSRHPASRTSKPGDEPLAK